MVKRFEKKKNKKESKSTAPGLATRPLIAYKLKLNLHFRINLIIAFVNLFSPVENFKFDEVNFFLTGKFSFGFRFGWTMVGDRMD